MARRALPLLLLALIVAGPATAGDIGKKKKRVDAKLAHVRQQLAASQRQEAVLTRQVGRLTTSIHAIELRVGGVSQRLAVLDRDIALHQARLGKLDELVRLETRRYRLLRRQYRLAVLRLDERLVHIYESPAPSTVEVLIAARSFHDLLDEMTYASAVAAQDRRIAADVRTAKLRAAAARRRTVAMRRTLATETQVIRGRAQQVAILQAQLLTSRGRLSHLRGARRQSLLATRAAIRQEIRESQSLQAASNALAARLRSGGGGSGSGTGGGTGGAPHFIWPVNGPITSPFGMRWGVLHPGIDIGVPTGTPVHAAAAGRVVWCGWMQGYGNFVVIDHGGGYATAYGHNSRVLVRCGEDVRQGQVVSLSGCTGYCTGPHVHFEVRVNGTPVDPLGYLG